LKIMHIDQQYRYSGGAEQYMISITKRLEELGHEVIVAYGKECEDTYHMPGRKEYCIPGIEKIPSFLNRDNTVLKSLTELIENENPDVIHVHNVRNFAVIKGCIDLRHTVRFIHDPTLCCFRDWKLLPDLKRICTKQVGIRCLFTLCLFNYYETPWGALAKKHQEIRIHKKLSRIIVASKYMKDLLIQNGIPSTNVAILPYFVPMAPAKSLSSSTNENIVLYIGLIHLIKGVDYLLAALKYVKSDFKAIFIGQGSYLEEYKRFAKELGIEEKVSFLGWIPNEELSRYYQQASLLVVPSRWVEAFGIIGIEAMAHGKPVVAFDTGGIPDWLEDGETGFLVEKDDLQGLAEKISLLLEKKELAKKMGENGRLKVSRQFQLDTHMDGLIKVYQGIKG
jgi:glycosyltransferase involved in cell wall biosynthesis